MPTLKPLENSLALEEREEQQRGLPDDSYDGGHTRISLQYDYSRTNLMARGQDIQYHPKQLQTRRNRETRRPIARTVKEAKTDRRYRTHGHSRVKRA